MQTGQFHATVSVVLALAIGATPSAVAAQIVRGTVVERADSTPVRGVLVALLDKDGRITARTLTDDHGRYRLSSAPGTYRVQTLRIGYRPALTQELSLSSGDDLERTIAIANIPVSLQAIEVAARRNCGAMSDSSVARVWEQVRGALIATSLSSSRTLLHATIRKYGRTMDASFRRTLNEWSRVDSGYVQTPWRSLPIDSLRRLGYVYQAANNSIVYNAPDLVVLTSNEFVQDYCFGLVRSTENDSMVRIAFEPTRDRSRLAGIRGEFLVDRKSFELRRMNFRYANVRVRGTDGAGGEMSFVRLGDGDWTISGWYIRMPIMEARSVIDPIPGAVAREEFRVLEWHVSGSELKSVRRGSETLWTDGAPIIVAAAPTATAPPPPPLARDTVQTRDTALTTKPSPATAMSTEFEERRRTGGGEFLTRADLEKHKGRDLADILSRVRGARILRDGNRAWVTSGRANESRLTERPQQPAGRPRPSRQACYANVWINGLQVFAGKDDEELFDIGTINPTSIEGIEFYPSPASTPVKYAGMDSQCGTLLIWTRTY